MKKLGKMTADVAEEPKSADWKVAVAAHMRSVTTATNPWLGAVLRMGHADGVSRYVGELRSGKRPKAAELLALISGIRV
jgi:hypothetical protein